MAKRAATLSTVLVLLALCCPPALAHRPAAASLDRSFGEDGFATLPDRTGALTVGGAELPNGDVLVNAGASLRALTSSGAPVEPFGVAAALGPPPSEGGDFSLGDFTVDSAGRLLVVGTSRQSASADEAPYGSNGEALAVPSAVRILRFLPNGSLDPSFGHGGAVETDFGLPPPRDEDGQPFRSQPSLDASGIAVDPQGRIVVTGSAAVGLGPSCIHDIFQPVTVSAAFFTRLTEDGAIDSSFGRGGVVGGRKPGENPLRAESVGEPVISPTGAITYRSTGLSACFGRWGVAQLSPDGSVREGLGRKGAVGGYFTALAGKPDGSVIALARMGWTEGEAFRARVLRIGPGGQVDRSFGNHGNTVVKMGRVWGNQPGSLAIDARGRVLIGGTLVTRRQRSIWLARLSADGRRESSFGPYGRVATRYVRLSSFSLSDMFFDARGRLVTVHQRSRRDETAGDGLVVARYLLRR